MSDDAQDFEIDAGAVAPFEDPAALDELRRGVFEGVGLPWAFGVLYGIGMARGLTDGLVVTQYFGAALASPPSTAGGPIPMIFTPESGNLLRRFEGSLPRSHEARLHRGAYPSSNDPICFVTSGYAAGWYSALLGDFYLVKETVCAACEAPECRFEAQPANAWLEADDAWARELLPYLDYQRLRDAALERIGADEELAEGPMFGGFDALSPAVHVWGPVMIVPYSGSEDSVSAVDAIRAEIGESEIRAVVVDVTGVRADPIEATGVLQLLDAIDERGLETVLVGLKGSADLGWLSRPSHPGPPVLAEALSEGIALAFQLCRRSPT